MKLLAFTGRMGSGKSTAIKILKKIQPRPIVVVKFAQPLYDIQEFAYKRIGSVYTRPDNFIKDRKLLQWLGTEWGREIVDKDIWVSIWKEAVKKYKDQDVLVVVDDVRFLNECLATQKMGGMVILIQNRRHLKEGLKDHISESGVPLKNLDVVVQNEGSLEEFENELVKLVKILELA